MRYYSSTAGLMALTADIAAGDTSLTVDTVTGLPVSYPFTVVLDPGQTSEEIVSVTAASGTTLTVTRAQDGTSGQAHSLGAEVRHMLTAQDLREPQQHIAAEAGVHGVTGDVVGTSDVQDLSNKVAVAADADTEGLVVKGFASQSAAILDVQDSSGSSVVSVGPDEGTLKVAGTTGINNTGSANLFKYVARLIASAADVVGVIVKGAASQTADLQQWQKSDGTVLAKVDKDGAITSPTVTALQSADTALDGRLDTLEGQTLDTRIDAIETNLGSQTTFVASSSSKNGKRIHWGSYTTSPDDSSGGFRTVTHAAGFTPTVVVVTGYTIGLQFRADTFTSTTFRLQVINSDGTANDGSTMVVSAFLGE